MNSTYSVDNLRRILTANEIQVVKSHCDLWKLLPEAVNALVELLLTAYPRGLSVFEVLQTWKRHDLNFWEKDNPTTDMELIRANLEAIYHELRLPSPFKS